MQRSAGNPTRRRTWLSGSCEKSASLARTPSFSGSSHLRTGLGLVQWVRSQQTTDVEFRVGMRTRVSRPPTGQIWHAAVFDTRVCVPRLGSS